MLTVLIYILMLKTILRGKEEHSLASVMTRVRGGKKDRKVVEKLWAKWSGFIFSVIISNYPTFTVIRYHPVVDLYSLLFCLR